MRKVFVLLLLLLNIIAAGQAQRRFTTAFLENNSRSPSTTLQLYLVTYDKAATVTVTVSQPRFNQTVLVNRDSNVIVSLGYEYMIYEKHISSKAVIVTSDADISAFVFYTNNESADAMACLPQEDLGTEYYIFTSGAGKANQFAVANGMEGVAWVNITVSGSISFNGFKYGNKETFSIPLEYQQVVQFQSQTDLTGTRIISTTPVAVFSGNKCFTGINAACDTIVAQLYPVQNWGRFFAVFPLLNHFRDHIHIMAARPNTLVYIEGSRETNQFILGEGSHIRLTMMESYLVNSTKPVMISYLFQDCQTGPVDFYDPFLTTIPPITLTRKYYKFVTQELYYNYLLIVSQSPSPSEFYLDHQPLDLYNVSIKVLNGSSGWEVFLGKTGGQHEIYHESSAFTISVYGIENYVSYGYSLGQQTKYPDPPFPQTTEEPESSSVLRCLSLGAVYQLPLSLVSEADLSVYDIHLEDPLCQAVQEGHWVIIKMPFNRCGSRVLIEDGKTFYVNTVYGTVPETSIHRIEVPVRCEMVGNETLGLNFHPKVTDMISLGHYNISLRLYQSEAFNDPITTYPYEIDLHGNLYVEFKVESDDKDLQIFTENCKSSPLLEDGGQTYNLIEHGCSQDSTVHEHPVLDHREQRFGFHVFKFENFQEVYLSCDVVICHNNSSPNRCTQGCLSRRHRRDVHTSQSQLESARLSQGPIVFNHGGPLQGSQDEFMFPSSVFISALCVVALLSCGALLLQKRYYRIQGYTLLQNRGE
ncbi:uncharacterized protein LOC142468184 isoform X1 [Ascaphus truei]|uniref:uncharacterized protein LOC142468184 isoform X1 n=1 Tax=Ascaphus truei TaxID=8439 RepID=UPI003F597366